MSIPYLLTIIQGRIANHKSFLLYSRKPFTLSSMQLQHLLAEYCDSFRVAKSKSFFQSYEHYIVGTVDGACLPVDQVCHRQAASQCRTVLYIINKQASIV